MNLSKDLVINCADTEGVYKDIKERLLASHAKRTQKRVGGKIKVFGTASYLQEQKMNK